jgi:ATP-dependent DNA ligase
MAFKGKDLRGLPLSQRRKILIQVVTRMNNPFIKVIPQWTGDIGGRFQNVVARGGEGLIIKDTRMGYGVGWAKMKKSHDVSVVIVGAKPGNGKYEGQVGAIEIAAWSGSKLVPIGFASGFDDKVRAEITHNLKAIVAAKTVVDIFAHELSKPSAESPCGRLRHPTFYRFREDVDHSDCTMDKVMKDLKKNPKTGRWK